MPKFIKFLLKNVPDKGNIQQWRLVIDNEADLKSYHNFDIKCNGEAFLGLERGKDGGIVLSHYGMASTRHTVLHQLLQLKLNTLKEGEKMYPIGEVANITNKKYLGMLKCISLFGAIQINEAGGYCDLKSFIKTWDADVLETIEKADFGFPLEDQIMAADTIILENSHPSWNGNYMEGKINNVIKSPGKVQTIYNLREIDHRYIFKSLSTCKNIVIESQIQDDAQVTDFMRLFSKLQPKNIYLFFSNDNIIKIKQHPLFYENEKLHNLYFK